MTLSAKIIIPTLLALSVAGCSARSFLSNTEFAVTVMFGQKLICETAKRTQCGVTLEDCTDQPGVRYECISDVVVIDGRKGLR